MPEDNEKIFNELLKDTPNSSTKDEIVLIIDRSGSMAGMQTEAQGGIRAFIEEQTKVGPANLTIVEFDNYINVVQDKVDIKETEEYILDPRGGTALLDAIGSVIGDKEKYSTKNGKTIVVVMTDGEENASKEWRRDKINDTINERKEDGWEFMFLAAEQDAIAVGNSYGFDKDSTVSFAGNSRGAQHATTLASAYSSNIRMHGKSKAVADKNAYVNLYDEFLSEEGEVKSK